MDGDECEPRTKLPARKSLFSSKPITAYGLDEYPYRPQTYPTSAEVGAFTSGYS